MRPRVKPDARASRKSRGAGHSSRVTTRAMVLHVARKTRTRCFAASEKSRLEEAIALTAAIGLEVVEGLIASIGPADARDADRCGKGR